MWTDGCRILSHQACLPKYSPAFFLQAWDDLIEKRAVAFEKSLAGSIDGGNGSSRTHSKIIIFSLVSFINIFNPTRKIDHTASFSFRYA